MNSRLWIVTPVYLDVSSFMIVRERVLEHLRHRPEHAGLEVHFVVADDTGGIDPDIVLLAEFDDVIVLEPPFNLGHQRAIVYALRTISREMEDDDLVVTMDADGEDAPEDVPRLLDELVHARSNRSVVLARRTERSESIAFKLFYLAFRALFKLLTGTVRALREFRRVPGLGGSPGPRSSALRPALLARSPALTSTMAGAVCG